MKLYNIFVTLKINHRCPWFVLIYLSSITVYTNNVPNDPLVFFDFITIDEIEFRKSKLIISILFY